MCYAENNNIPSYYFTTNINETQKYSKFITCTFGDAIGRRRTPYTYPAASLEAKAGESVMSVLEKMIKVMGNFECYYDTLGEFIFKEIENSLY